MKTIGKKGLAMSEGSPPAVAKEEPGWRTRASRRTTCVYFRHEREMRLVRRAAAALGIPFTRFIREACVKRANDIMEKAS
jgi:hypothetical protein